MNVLGGISETNVAKLDELVGKTGLSHNDAFGLAMDITNWISDEKIRGYCIVAITVERREPMPDFYGAGMLRSN